jgi:hypothetical protein
MKGHANTRDGARESLGARGVRGSACAGFGRPAVCVQAVGRALAGLLPAALGRRGGEGHSARPDTTHARARVD